MVRAAEALGAVVRYVGRFPLLDQLGRLFPVLAAVLVAKLFRHVRPDFGIFVGKIAELGTGFLCQLLGTGFVRLRSSSLHRHRMDQLGTVFTHIGNTSYGACGGMGATIRPPSHNSQGMAIFSTLAAVIASSSDWAWIGVGAPAMRLAPSRQYSLYSAKTGSPHSLWINHGCPPGESLTRLLVIFR